MCATSLCPLPPTAQELADVIGRDAALALCRAVKHRVLYVPISIDSKRRGERCCAWIERTIGRDLTLRLVKEFGGMQLPLANCGRIARAERREKIYLEFLGGKSSKQLALEYGLSLRWVRKRCLEI